MSNKQYTSEQTGGRPGGADEQTSAPILGAPPVKERKKACASPRRGSCLVPLGRLASFGGETDRQLAPLLDGVSRIYAGTQVRKVDE